MQIELEATTLKSSFTYVSKTLQVYNRNKLWNKRACICITSNAINNTVSAISWSEVCGEVLVDTNLISSITTLNLSKQLVKK